MQRCSTSNATSPRSCRRRQGHPGRSPSKTRTQHSPVAGWTPTRAEYAEGSNIFSDGAEDGRGAMSLLGAADMDCVVPSMQGSRGIGTLGSGATGNMSSHWNCRCQAPEPELPRLPRVSTKARLRRRSARHAQGHHSCRSHPHGLAPRFSLADEAAGGDGPLVVEAMGAVGPTGGRSGERRSGDAVTNQLRRLVVCIAPQHCRSGSGVAGGTGNNTGGCGGGSAED